jgi:hypothetical protein
VPELLHRCGRGQHTDEVPLFGDREAEAVALIPIEAMAVIFGEGAARDGEVACLVARAQDVTVATTAQRVANPARRTSPAPR